MKIKKGFMLKELDGQTVAIPVASDFNGVVKMNDTAAYIWQLLEKEATKEELVTAILKEYKTTLELAEEAVENTLKALKADGFLED